MHLDWLSEAPQNYREPTSWSAVLHGCLSDCMSKALWQPQRSLRWVRPPDLAAV